MFQVSRTSSHLPSILLKTPMYLAVATVAPDASTTLADPDS